MLFTNQISVLNSKEILPKENHLNLKEKEYAKI